jgi:hypothetical protein
VAQAPSLEASKHGGLPFLGRFPITQALELPTLDDGASVEAVYIVGGHRRHNKTPTRSKSTDWMKVIQQAEPFHNSLE